MLCSLIKRDNKTHGQVNYLAIDDSFIRALHYSLGQLLVHLTLGAIQFRFA